ncbi:MAG: hypothetical protein ABIJ40_13970, partial [Bacteroidota bacterium]
WLKKEVKKCVGTENVCLSYKDCEEDVSCEIDKRNAEEQKYKCSVDELKTIGLGGSPVEQPDNNWAGVCPAEQAGCTEYIDPISKYATNILLNSDFSQMSGSFPWYYPAHWYKDIIDYEGCEGLFDCDQNIKLEKNTLYILAVEGNNTTTIATTSNIFYELDSNNRLTGPVSAISVVATTTKISKRFYVDDNGFDGVINVAAAINSNKVELKKALINYQLKQNLDKAICHGKVDFEKGCVLFNERAMNASSGLAELTWDADRTVEDGSGVAPETGDEDEASKRDSNNIIKVSPDRICDKWLDCENTINIGGGQSVCLNIKICDKFTDSGDCDNWLTVVKENQTFPTNISKGDISNMTGYVKVGYYGIGTSTSIYPNDYYPLGTAESVGLSASVPNGNFELSSTKFNESTYEVVDIGPEHWDCDLTECEVLYNPVAIQDSGSCYTMKEGTVCEKFAPEGQQFLALNGGKSAKTKDTAATGFPSQYIKVAANSDYILTAYINTIRLTQGIARIKIDQYTESSLVNNVAITSITYDFLDAMKPWTFRLGKFSTIDNITQIKITLDSHYPVGYSGLAGDKVYFDNIQIRTALESHDILNSNNFWYTPQSCRLYPQQDSLSCDYYADSGIRYKGVSGYCLEYDRYPGSSDACLLWWSVPDGGSRSNEYCGDGKVNGDEDCDCGEDENGNILTSCSNEDFVDSLCNQYMCISCR